jgi:cytoskeletal protein CcmA (bactofilin family)
MENPKKNRSSATPTLVSKGCTLHGTIKSSVFTRVDGYINGDLFIDENLIVGEGGLIDGNIETNEIIVYGTINGVIKAKSINIKSSGKIIGGLNTSNLQIDKGAIYIGSIAMNKNENINH